MTITTVRRSALLLAALFALTAGILLASTSRADAISNSTGCSLTARDDLSSAHWDGWGSPIVQARLMLRGAGLQAGAPMYVTVRTQTGSVVSGWHHAWCQSDYVAGPGYGLWVKVRVRIDYEVAWPAWYDGTGGTPPLNAFYGWTHKRRCAYQNPTTGAWIGLSTLGGYACNIG